MGDDQDPPPEDVATDDIPTPPPVDGGAFKAAKPAREPKRKPTPRFRRTMTLMRFRQIEAVLKNEGFGEMIAWSEAIQPCQDARAFALEAVYVICNSGMNFKVANGIYWRVVAALRARQSAKTVFGHPGKAPAIDFIWKNRRVLFAAYDLASNKLAFCATLPWIGPVTKFHLAKNLGVDVAKPDVHLERLAKAEGISVVAMCMRLAKQTGYRVTTIDSILWRACADGYLVSSVYRAVGWTAATAKLREAMTRLPAEEPP